MQRAKLLVAFSGALLVLAVAAIPASAWFSANTSGATQGQFHSGGASVLTGAGGGAIKCSKAAGEWHIESSGKASQQQKTEQFLTKEGPHLALTVTKWEGCNASGLTVEVEACTLQLQQPEKGVNTGSGSVATACQVSIPAIGCKFEVPPSKNEGLPEAKYATAGTNVEAKAAISGVTTVVPTSSISKCALGGVTNASNSEFKSITIAEAVKLV